jgi:hypothetical protein
LKKGDTAAVLLKIRSTLEQAGIEFIAASDGEELAVRPAKGR